MPTGVCNAVYFRLCIDLMHITPPVTAEGYNGSHHPRYAECKRRMCKLILIYSLHKISRKSGLERQVRVRVMVNYEILIWVIKLITTDTEVNLVLFLLVRQYFFIL